MNTAASERKWFSLLGRIGRFWRPFNAVSHTPSSSFAPTRARFFDLVNANLQFTPEEMALLERNGFVVSDRLAFENFALAYAYLHQEDLPVLITTDSLLHAIHQTYDDLLIKSEEVLLFPRLSRFLQDCRAQLQKKAQANTDPGLASLLSDLDIYLAVPLALLTEESQAGENAEAVALYREMAEKATRIASVSLFGSERLVDFTLFTPRGHYLKVLQSYSYSGRSAQIHEEPHFLQRYFRAMMWLSQIDFRLVEYDTQGTPRLHVEHLAAAALLAQAIKQSSADVAWNELDTFLRALIGDSDNVTLGGLECFLRDAALETPEAIFQASHLDQCLHLLLTGDYGQQRIAGQLQYADPARKAAVPQHVSFLLLGQRFAIDSYITSNLVYDRLKVDGKPQRLLPSPLDVMYVLGNDRAEMHLREELATYGYQDRLRTLREEIGWKLPTFWAGSIYHRLLDVIRTLSPATTNETYPVVMRSPAWADKILQTQLASWTQMRHDNMLYVKQSTTLMVLCEYPAGYVEPSPACYAAMSDYARMGQQLFRSLKPDELTASEQDLCQLGIQYFQHLETVTNRLTTLAEKELAQEPFSHEEEAWVKETAVRRMERCGSGGAQATWTGWYPQLFFQKQWNESPALIADVHTNPPSDISPASVLHVATGQVAAMPFIINTDEGTTMYVGPAFTYYEMVTRAPMPLRLTDEEWKKRLLSTTCPAAPPWTRLFRFSNAEIPRQLSPSNRAQPRS